jgi:NAD+ synthase
MTAFGPAALELDAEAEATFIADALRSQVASLKRRGLVLGLSGGVDSAVCAALAVRALGPGRVVALLMPDRDTPTDATRRAVAYASRLGIEAILEDVDPALEVLGSHRLRDAAVRQVFPDLPNDYRAKIVIAADPLLRDRLPYFDLVVDGGNGGNGGPVRRRMPPDAYLAVVAATNMKQRTRKLVEYTHADRRNLAVLGTPNRLEFALGFFVRGGDGLADVKPIAHLYKTQVFALAAALGVDDDIRSAVPSTDTYSLPQTQEEFFFGMSLAQTDLLLFGLDHDIDHDAIAEGMGFSRDQVDRVLRDMAGKRRRAAVSSGDALLVRPVAVHD